MAVNTPLTRRAAATSCPNRIRNSGSAASSSRMTLTATRRPPRGDAEEHSPHATAAELAYEPVRTDRLRILGLQSSDHAAPNVTQNDRNNDNDT